MQEDDRKASELQIDPELYRKLIGMFFEQSDEVLKEVANGIERQDSEVIRQRLHFLKGSASGLHLRDIQACLQKLEDQVKVGVQMNLISEEMIHLERLLQAEKDKRVGR